MTSRQVLSTPLGLVWFNVAVAAAYFVASVPVSEFFAALGFFPAPFWPGAGVALFAVVYGGVRAAPGIFAGSVAVNALLFASPPEIFLSISAFNTLGPLAGGLLFRRYLPLAHPFLSSSDAGRFLGLAVVLHPIVTGAGGASVLVAFGEPAASWLPLFTGWIISDAAGTLLVGAPALLWWVDRRQPDLGHLPGLAAVAVLMLAVAMSRLILPDSVSIPSGVPFLVVLASTWLVARYPPREATLLFAVVAVLIAAGFAASPTPVLIDPPITAARVLGLAMAAGMLNVLMIGVVTEERALAVRRWWRDELTDLPNQRSFFAGGALELARAARHRRPLAVLLIAVDELETIHHHVGEAAGDALIIAVAGHAAAQVRTADTLARLGDGHFVVLLPEADEAEARATAKRIAASITSTPFAVRGSVFMLSTRSGVATRRVGDAIQTLTGRARSALVLTSDSERIVAA